MTKRFHELLLSELRMVVYIPGKSGDLTDKLLCKAVTVNENLASLGYTLKPEDLVRLAVSPSLDGFFRSVEALVPQVTAEPMYPGFPKQVMEMSEAQFRLHQLIHYFSTYFVEGAFGVQVKRGWLPCKGAGARVKEDKTLFDARVLELVPEEDAPAAALSRLLARRERLIPPELALVLEAAASCEACRMQGVKVRFKENVELLFPMLMEKADSETALRTLRSVCAHTGDVLRCSGEYLRLRKYHLHTREKKLLTRLLESYPVWDLRGNLMHSLARRERNLLVLQHLDYNRFSGSPEHREAVRALRSGELRSWHGTAEALLREKSPQALSYIAQRPGYMVRMLNRLQDLGYSKAAIAEAITPRAGAVSAHLLMNTIKTLLAKAEENLEWEYARQREECYWQFRREEHSLQPDAIRESCARALENLPMKAEQKQTQAKQKYLWIPLGNAVEAARQKRQHLERVLGQQEVALQDKRMTIRRLEEGCPMGKSLVRNAHWGYDREQAMFCLNSAAWYQELERMEQALQEAKASFPTECETIAREEAEQVRRIQEEGAKALEREQEKIALWQQQEAVRLQAECARNLEEAPEKLRCLPQREQAAMEALEQKFARKRQLQQLTASSVEILREVLSAHFRQVATPLKGKKVCTKLEKFDLKHSSLETDKRSKDGGYIPSGISYRIPEDAGYVRLFVYWDDPSRVDIDLHAGGVTTDGSPMEIGWNSDFRESGVVYSGDITHSDAAEYIDIDLSAPIQEIYANVHLFSGKHSFRGVEKCYVGMMAVRNAEEEVALYSPKNCFFTHPLTQNTVNLFYGYVDVRNRFVRFVGQPNVLQSSWYDKPAISDLFTLEDYLNCVLANQDITFVDSEEEADVVLTMEKSLLDKGVSLVDSNFFLEC